MTAPLGSGNGDTAAPAGLLQLLAVVAALLLIAAAFGIRAIVQGGDGGGGDESVEAGEGGDDEIVLGCVGDLMELCSAIDGGDTPLRLVQVDATGAGGAADAGEIDAWVTFEPWEVAVEFETGDDGLFGETIPVAEDEIGLMLSEEYAEDLEAACDVRLTVCAARQTATDPTARLGIGDPGSSLGTILIAAALAELTETAEFDADAIDEFDADVRRVLGTMRATDQPRFLSELGSPGTVAVLAREGDTLEFVNSEQGKQKNLEFVPTKPVIRARVVMAPVEGADRDRLEALVGIGEDSETASALEELEWNNVSDQPTNLPDGDVLLAVAQRYRG